MSEVTANSNGTKTMNMNEALEAIQAMMANMGMTVPKAPETKALHPPARLQVGGNGGGQVGGNGGLQAGGNGGGSGKVAAGGSSGAAAVSGSGKGGGSGMVTVGKGGKTLHSTQGKTMTPVITGKISLRGPAKKERDEYDPVSAHSLQYVTELTEDGGYKDAPVRIGITVWPEDHDNAKYNGNVELFGLTRLSTVFTPQVWLDICALAPTIKAYIIEHIDV